MKTSPSCEAEGGEGYTHSQFPGCRRSTNTPCTTRKARSLGDSLIGTRLCNQGTTADWECCRSTKRCPEPDAGSGCGVDQTMAIQDGMDGAFRGDLDAGEAAKQALANFTSTPAGVLVLHVEDVVFNLKGKLRGIAIRSTASIGESFYTAVLNNDQRSVLREIPNSLQSSAIGSPASRRATNFSLSSITEHSFQRHSTLPQKAQSVTHVSGTNCYYVSGRS
jgi:hypothetical protein